MRLPLGSAPTSGVRGSLSKHSRKLVVQVRPTLPKPLHPSNNGDPAVVHSALEQLKPTLAHHPTVDLDAPCRPELVWPNRFLEGATLRRGLSPEPSQLPVRSRPDLHPGRKAPTVSTWDVPGNRSTTVMRSSRSPAPASRPASRAKDPGSQPTSTNSSGSQAVSTSTPR